MTPHQILKQFWGYDAFRPMQEDIIQSVLNKQDTLALLPTGGGKSICFQVPGLALPGLTLVISPLIALMRDQVDNLNRIGISATYINSSQSFGEIDQKLAEACQGKYKFLYCAPERLQTEMFLNRLPQLNVSLLAIDESHCISQWGYDFRPSYLEIKLLREHLPKVPIIALTATATPEVREDIIEQLELREAKVFVKSFRRDNLSYEVIATDNVAGNILRLLKNSEGSGIIYCRTRKRTKAVADYLKKNGISASFYHGGLPNTRRTEVQQQWIQNETRIIAATNAFGMGIDKPDVRQVFHLNLPADLESYYQEAGRAGRDGKPATAYAFRNEKDLDELKRWVEEKYPTWEAINRHYEVLCNYYGIPNTQAPTKMFPFDIADIVAHFKMPLLPLYNSTRLLSREGILHLDENTDDYASIKVSVAPREILHYKDKYPHSAELIDYMLRSLGGEVYSEYMRFYPPGWANKLYMPEKDLLKQLHVLHQSGIIRFQPPSAYPRLQFLFPRHQLTRNELNWHKYNFLIKQAQKRYEALLGYLEAPIRQCRSVYLEGYFGEESEGECGVCDHCRQKAQKSEGDQGFQSMVSEVLELLKDGEINYNELIVKMKTGSWADRKEAVRFLMDKRKVLIGDGMKLRLGN